jgi:hypothetical protein
MDILEKIDHLKFIRKCTKKHDKIYRKLIEWECAAIMKEEGIF